MTQPKERTSETIFAVRGRKDGKLRRVEHLPINMSTRRTPASMHHWWMRLWTSPTTWVTQKIAHSRVEKIKSLERISELGKALRE